MAVEQPVLLYGSLSDWTAADRLDSGASGVGGVDLKGARKTLRRGHISEFALRAPVVAISGPAPCSGSTRIATSLPAIKSRALPLVPSTTSPSMQWPCYTLEQTGAAGQTLVPDATPTLPTTPDRQVLEMTVSAASLGLRAGARRLYRR